MSRLLTFSFAALTLGFALMMSPVFGQETGAGTGADAADAGADTTGTADTTGGTGGGDAIGDDESGFDPGWIGLAGLLGLAGLMGRDRDHNRRVDTPTGTGTHH
jgi:hypothetical protein